MMTVIKELIEQIGGRERLVGIKSRIEMYGHGAGYTADEVELMARALLAVLDAQQSPVWGQARFKGGEWSSCTPEHAAMVMVSPDEWAGYECRYLYATPPAASVLECEWTYDEGDYFWSSSCGEGWQFTDGCPEENRVKFCQGCGGLVRIASAPAPENKK